MARRALKLLFDGTFPTPKSRRAVDRGDVDAPVR
jgi:hypothetical protein